LELIHKVKLSRHFSERLIDSLCFNQTETDDVPTALMAFQGRLCAGVGKSLRLYEIGKKKLLRKVETKVRMHTSYSTPTR
jgi:hypothetical protein